MSLSLYSQRLKDHLSDASILHASGDYVQAGEKVWGALSALVNLRSSVTVKSVMGKKTVFASLFNNYLVANPSLRPQMRQLGFRRDMEIFDAIFGLHLFFYGGANYSNAQLSRTIPFFIQILTNL